MDVLIVSNVKSASKRMLFQLGGADKCNESFCFMERFFIANT